jgi:hypothetical protein
MTPMDPYQGACHCGRVRFALDGPPMMSACCHCSLCRRWTGAAYSMIGFWQPERCQVTAEPPLIGALDDLTRPTCHIYYADRIVDMADGLPQHDRFKWSPRVSAG